MNSLNYFEAPDLATLKIQKITLKKSTMSVLTFLHGNYYSLVETNKVLHSLGLRTHVFHEICFGRHPLPQDWSPDFMHLQIFLKNIFTPVDLLIFKL